MGEDRGVKGPDNAYEVVVSVGNESRTYSDCQVEIIREHGIVQIWKNGEHLATAALPATLIVWSKEPSVYETRGVRSV